MDTQTNAVLNELESKVKDRFTHYLLVVMDGDQIYHVLDSTVVALGMAELMADVIRQKWAEA